MLLVREKMQYLGLYMQKVSEFLKTTPYKNYEIEIASADASFRRYFRLKKGKESLILMDSSLELESLKPFVDVTTRLLDVGVDAPNIYFQDLEQGYLVLQDLGSTDLLTNLNKSNFKDLYKVAIGEIIKMQKADITNLPIYDDKFLKFEMNLMQEWFLEKYLKIDLNNWQKKMIENTLNIILKEVLKQPQNIFVHRDFHSRNIMNPQNNRLGIIDYQDAMNGAVTYDLVSLLKDLYVRYEPKYMEELALYFRDLKGIKVSDEEFLKWFDFMGLQRHIKVLGIFARLYLRDAKDGYLKNLPLTLKYVLETAKKYDETKELYNFFLGIIK